MDADESRFADLLQQAVGEPEVGVSFERLAGVRRRRRRTTVLVATAAVAVLVVAVPLGWRAASQGGDGRTLVLKPTPSPTATPVTDGRCPATEPLPRGQVVSVDHVDFVRFDGREYVAQVPDEHVSPAQLGFAFGQVNCQISTLTEPGDRKVSGPYRDGNAAYLPVRTMLRAVSGYERSCRIGALVDDRVRVYLAQQEDGPVSTPRRCALTPSPDAPVVTRCDALPPVPQRVEVNTLLDAENKVLEYTYGNDNTTFTINYGADPTCRQRADVRLLLDHALEAAGSTQ